MALAGLWENWKSPEGERIRSFAIVTTTPNEPVQDPDYQPVTPDSDPDEPGPTPTEPDPGPES